ncbi:MAG: UDP-N-acetylmuramoyl-tripeptide--D-alanyl-D-alanine ligase [bacterium]
MIELARKTSLTIDDILTATGADLWMGSRSATFSGVSIDSRTIGPQELFWTLKGDRFDSHAFVNEVIGRGAAGAVVGPEFTPAAEDWPQGKFLIRVKDRLLALQETARHLRQQYPVPLVAITGSNGKTTTKEMIASIMTCKGKVLKTEGNRNNLIGLPLTLCGLSDEVKAVVLELGMNAFGEIRSLTRICQPDVGLITNIGPAHIEFFGSLEKISQAKGELYDEMKPEAVAVINLDDPYCLKLASRRSRIITFGLREGADLRGENIRQEETKTSFVLRTGAEKVDITIPLVGRVNVYNALAAAAAARALRIPLSHIRRGLEQVTLPPMRMMRLSGPNGSIILNDAYNANPASMCSAIDTLIQSKKGEGRAILVLGDMLELGPDAERFHRQVGRLVAHNSIDFLFTFGPLAHWIAEEALASGMDKNCIFPDLNHNQIAETLKTLLAPGDRILIKGSRGARMEGVASLLVDK